MRCPNNTAGHQNAHLQYAEQKKRKELERMLANLKKNDHVVTIGGIYGTVVAATPNSKVITIRIDDSTGTKIKILRSAISHVSSPEELEENDKSAT